MLLSVAGGLHLLLTSRDGAARFRQQSCRGGRGRSQCCRAALPLCGYRGAGPGDAYMTLPLFNIWTSGSPPVRTGSLWCL